MKKDLGIIGGLFLVIVILIVFGSQYTTGNFAKPSGRQGSTPSAQESSGENTEVAIGDLRIDAIVADSADERKKGLSDRDELPITQGMLFVFDTSSDYAIWMKDMRFPIDIIWIDEQKRVVDAVVSATPEPGKSDDELKIYRPRSKAKYILEINAGLVKLHDIKIGDEVNFVL